MKRRSLLQWSISAGAVVSADVLGDIVAVTSPQKTASLQALDPGQSVGFTGDGYYLYPDWGTPRVYQIVQVKEELLFSYPGKNQTLWRQSANSSRARFSARLK